MKDGAIGAVAGLVLGLLVGTALFGPGGGAAGSILGAILGFFVVTPLTVALAVESAEQPFFLKCPEIGKTVRVTLDPKEAARAKLWNRPYRIATCSRFGGRPTCNEGCLDQLRI